jgi:hypothetical protein
MNFNKKKYIDEVLKLIAAPRKIKKRINEDLNQRIDEALDDDVYYDVYNNMGTPIELAEEFNHNLETTKEYYGITIGTAYTKIKSYEFKSKANLFGLPLIHINTGGSYKTNKAVGVIAIGDIAVGFITFGGVSTGVIAIGAVAVGPLAFGAVAVGGVAFGAVAVGAYAFGAVAIGFVKVFGQVIHIFN